MLLDLGKLDATELKTLSLAVKEERDRRGKRNPTNHEPPTWVIPNMATQGVKKTTREDSPPAS